MNEPLQNALFLESTNEKLNGLGEVRRAHGGHEQLPGQARDLLTGADICITSWGSPAMTGDLLSGAINLRFMAYAAGSVKPVVTDELWERGIRVTSSAAANGVDVAHTTVALMVLAWKNAFLLSREISEAKEVRPTGRVPHDLYRTTIGIVGAGHIGRLVMKLLADHEPDILLFDPFVTPAEAQELGARKCESLDELMAASDVISLHAPSLPETRHMLNRHNLKLMKPGAVLVNTARGALIDEDALVEVISGTDRFVCLDVTDPEPTSVNSPLRKLPNVLLTPHLAGSVNEGIARMGALAVEQVRRFLAGEALQYEVTADMLARIA